MPRKDIDYSKCVIYKIVCNDLNVKYIYIGHTTDFTKRKSHHKYACNHSNNKEYNCKVYKTIRDNGGFENWTIVIVERMENCKDSEEARSRERYWYEQLSANLNTFRPIVSDDEIKDQKLRYIKVYNEINKDKLQQYRKVYNEITTWMNCSPKRLRFGDPFSSFRAQKPSAKYKMILNIFLQKLCSKQFVHLLACLLTTRLLTLRKHSFLHFLHYFVFLSLSFGFFFANKHTTDN